MRARVAVLALLAVATLPLFAEPDRGRMVVLLFDTGGSSSGSLERARRSAIEYVATSAANDRFAVATIGRDGVRFAATLAAGRWEDEARPHADVQLIDGLAALAARMASVSGVKHVVLLSERAGVADTGRAARMHQRFRDAGVVLDAVDIRPPSVAEGLTVNATPAGRQTVTVRPSEFLAALSLETGGTVVSTLEQLQRGSGGPGHQHHARGPQRG